MRSNGPNGQSCSGDGSLLFNGSSNGTHSKTFACSGSGPFAAAANVGSGQVTITVKDGAGAQVYGHTFKGPGQEGDSTQLSGASGTWTITATRAGSTFGSFSGQYSAGVNC